MKHSIGQFQVVGGSNASGGLRRIGQSHHELSADACPFFNVPHEFWSHDPSTLANCLGFDWLLVMGGRLEVLSYGCLVAVQSC